MEKEQVEKALVHVRDRTCSLLYEDTASSWFPFYIINRFKIPRQNVWLIGTEWA